MTIVAIIFFIAFLGAIGALVNCAITEEFHLPHFDREAKIWRPGWLGNVITGSVAAIVVWGIYGPLSAYDLATCAQEIHLTLAQIFISPLVGMSGGHILTLMAQKEAERLAKNTLATTLKDTQNKLIEAETTLRGLKK